MEFRFGWLVVPLIEATAPSATSHAGVGGLAEREAALMPLVSWVWKWIGMPTSSRSAFTSFSAA